MPYQLDGIQILAFRRGLSPVDSRVLVVFLCHFDGVLRVVILHTPMTVRERIGNEWHQMFLQHVVHEEFCFHYTTKYGDVGCTVSRNTSPDVNLVRVFRPTFLARRFPPSMERDPSVLFHRHRTLVRENDVAEGFFGLQAAAAIIKPLRTVNFLYQLTMFGASC